MKINPKFKSLIPPLSSKEFQLLEQSIVADGGCRDPLVLWADGGILLDGHNRYEISQRHKLPFKTISIECGDENAAIAWIIRNQFGRRNITLATRCKLAKQLAEALKPLAKANQKARKGKQAGAKSPNIGKVVDTLKDAAKEAGVSHGSLSAYEFLEENATPEELAEVETNPEAKLHRVVKDVKERTQKAKRRKKRAEAARDAKHNDRIIIGDFTKETHRIYDGSLSLIFTDPPYDKNASKLFPALADFAAAKLADGGSLVMYLGHLQLPAAFKAFDGKLRHWWTCACVHSGDKVLMREYGIRAGWKPMLWFVKGTRDDKSAIVFDTVTGSTEKDSHDWQQAESEASYWIENLCPKDGIVCDPFLGGGTTAAAAQKLGRRWIGIELDPETAKIASKRIA